MEHMITDSVVWMTKMSKLFDPVTLKTYGCCRAIGLTDSRASASTMVLKFSRVVSTSVRIFLTSTIDAFDQVFELIFCGIMSMA